MRLETTYKYLWRHGWDYCYEQNSYNRRKIRRAGRHQANLDTRRAANEALDDIDFENMQFLEDSLNYQGFTSYREYEEFLDMKDEPEPDYEAQANKWELENDEDIYPDYETNDDFMFRNRLGEYSGWEDDLGDEF